MLECEGFASLVVEPLSLEQQEGEYPQVLRDFERNRTSVHTLHRILFEGLWLAEPGIVGRGCPRVVWVWRKRLLVTNSKTGQQFNKIHFMPRKHATGESQQRKYSGLNMYILFRFFGKQSRT